MEEEAEKLKEMQGEVEKQMMSAKTGEEVASFAPTYLYDHWLVLLIKVALHFLHWKRNRKWMQDLSISQM